MGVTCALSVLTLLVFRFVQNFRKFKEEALFDDGGVSIISKLTCKVKQLLRRPGSSVSAQPRRNGSIYEHKNSVSVIVKLFVLYFLSHAPDVTDSLLGKSLSYRLKLFSDAYYFYSLEKDLFGIKRLSLTNPGRQVVISMAVFVFMALLKDTTCCLWSISSRDFYHKKFSMSASQNMRLKTIKLVLNLLMEDVCQIITQYFYFEKVLLEKSNFVYMNAVIVFISGAFNLKVLKINL